MWLFSFCYGIWFSVRINPATISRLIIIYSPNSSSPLVKKEASSSCLSRYIRSIWTSGRALGLMKTVIEPERESIDARRGRFSSNHASRSRGRCSVRESTRAHTGERIFSPNPIILRVDGYRCCYCSLARTLKRCFISRALLYIDRLMDFCVFFFPFAPMFSLYQHCPCIYIYIG